MTDIIPEAHSHGASVTNTLTRKVGPFPGYVWAGLVIVGYLLYRKFYGARKASASVDPAAQLSGAADPVTGGVSYGSAGSGSTGTNTTGGAFTTNAQWEANALRGLVGEGLNPSDVSNALNSYVNGKSVTGAQQLIINRAILEFGPPPEGVLPVTVTPIVTNPPPKPAPPVAKRGAPKPAPKPVHKVAPPKHAAPRYYTVKSGDTLYAIAERYYGNGSQYIRIAAANHLSNPNLIHPGQRLVIP